MGAMNEVNAKFPETLDFLFQPARYKVLYGGRGGAKSWGVARALLIQGAQSPLRILCAREFQNSIGDSVHHLLRTQIEALKLDSFYQIQNASITGLNGTEFVFAGLRNNTSRIKSFEAIDRAWIEEAQTVSKSSWKDLMPTIRKDGSEIWITFNPELETDETYQRFVVNPPTDAIVRKVNWTENPFFNAVLEQERLDDLKRDPVAYRNIWEGECRSTLEGAIYGNEIRKAEEEGRIMSVPYDALKQVHTFWDLGWADNTSIWFAQSVGPELRLIDYYSNQLQPLQHYMQVLQGKGYIYGTDWLPHDARAKSLATGRSVEEIMLSMGRKVQITPNLSLFDGINAARTIFNRCYFDKDKCSEGLQALRHYRYDIDPESKQLSGKPLHDWASHGADAFRYFALSIGDDAPAVSARGIKMVGWRA
jgi:phage terminase large subunit